MGASTSNLQAKSAGNLVSEKHDLNENDKNNNTKASGCPYKHDQEKSPMKSECPVTGASTDDINPYNMVSMALKYLYILNNMCMQLICHELYKFICIQLIKYFFIIM